MSTRYLPLLNAIRGALAQINDQRVVTRNWDDFANRPQPELQKGVWIIRPGGITSYPYEVSDNQFDSDSLRATEHGRLRVTVIGQQQLAPNCTGEDVDEAEFQMIHELEQLADDAMQIDGLQTLLLKSVRMSEQVEKPMAWVASTWEVFNVE